LFAESQCLKCHTNARKRRSPRPVNSSMRSAPHIVTMIGKVGLHKLWLKPKTTVLLLFTLQPLVKVQCKLIYKLTKFSQHVLITPIVKVFYPVRYFTIEASLGGRHYRMKSWLRSTSKATSNHFLVS